MLFLFWIAPIDIRGNRPTRAGRWAFGIERLGHCKILGNGCPMICRGEIPDDVDRVLRSLLSVVRQKLLRTILGT